MSVISTVITASHQSWHISSTMGKQSVISRTARCVTHSSAAFMHTACNTCSRQNKYAQNYLFYIATHFSHNQPASCAFWSKILNYLFFFFPVSSVSMAIFRIPSLLMNAYDGRHEGAKSHLVKYPGYNILSSTQWLQIIFTNVPWEGGRPAFMLLDRARCFGRDPCSEPYPCSSK